MDSTVPRTWPNFARASGRLLFTAALALSLLFGSMLGRPNHDGDVMEYATMASAMAAHGTPDIRYEDLHAARKIIPAHGMHYDDLDAGMRDLSRQLPMPGFARTTEGEVFAIHFFTYSALAAIALTVLGALGLPASYAFVAVNLTAATVLGTALHRLFGSASRTTVGILLFFACGGILYWNWSSPEFASAAALLAALAFFCTGAPVVGGLLAGMAASHNPPIVFFAAFAPAFLTLMHFSEGASLRTSVRALNVPRIYIGAALCVTLAAAPFLFNLYQFGILSWITKMSTQPTLIGWPRLMSFFLDPNQGMIVAVPVLASALAVCGWRNMDRAQRHCHGLLLACTASFTFALSVPALSALNWNSAASGVMRYGVWSAMPLLFAFLLYLRAQKVFPRALVALVLASQALCMFNAKGYRWLEFSPVAHWLLRHAPAIYNPDPEIFFERLTMGETIPDTTAVYSYIADGRVTKTMYNTGGGGVQHLCGPGSLLVTPSVNAGYGGWRYFNGPTGCTSSEKMDADTLARRRLLESGWSNVEHGGGTWNGVWSDGRKSRITLHPKGRPGSAILRLTGHYFEGNHRTRLSINGTDLGWHVLDNEQGIDISDVLDGSQSTVEIELEHEQPGGPSPRVGDTRQIAYFLQQVELR